MSTKERILQEALIMFAENGYKGTNLRDLAERLSLSKSALYRHYENKEAIWVALIDRMDAYYEEQVGSERKMPPVPDSMDELVALTMRMIDVTIHDEKIVLTRKFLMAEQCHDERTAKIATMHFLTGLEGMFKPLLAGMMEKGLLKKCDADMLAFEYTSPITSMIHLCTREPAQEKLAMVKIQAHMAFFDKIYGVHEE